MGILFSAPHYEYSVIKDEWLEAVDQLSKQGVFVGGPRVSKFESSFADYIGAKGTVGVGNGTDALFLALKALNIGPGDEVITVANTFVATVAAIHHTGASPVFVDCDEYFLIDLDQVKQKLSSKTKAVIVVHLYGNMVNLIEMSTWAIEHGIAIIEDCAQATGARLEGRMAGGWGIMGCYSFYPEKNLGALGDGGAIVSSSSEMLAILRKLRNHGGEIRYQHEIPGYNSRLDPLQACALQLKLRYLDEWNAHRIQAAGWYQDRLSGIEVIQLPSSANQGAFSHVYHLYVIRIANKRRDEMKKHLQKKGILSGVNYPVPVHLLPAYAFLGYQAGSFPNAERFAAEILSLPMHAALKEEEVDHVCSEIKVMLQL